MAYVKRKNLTALSTYKIQHPEYVQEVRTKPLDEKMKNLLLNEFNRASYEYDLKDSVVRKFEKLVKKHPQKVAVKCGTRILTYEELNKKANKIANGMMQTLSLKPDDVIAIVMERSEVMIASILAIWKTGAAYLPIDTKYPLDRINGLIVDSNAKLVLMDDTSLWEDKLDITNTKFCSVKELKEIKNIPDTNPNCPIELSSLAYVIYTSGSTGKPKGVMIEHLGMLNHMGAKIVELGIDANANVAQNAPHCFDISIWQMFAGLITGGKTVVYPYETVLDPKLFLQNLETDEISVLELVPSYFVEMLNIMEENVNHSYLKKLSILVLNAETLMPDAVKRWFACYPHCPIVNTYGATEVSDDTSHFIMYSLPDTATIPVMKRPIQHFKIYIVDQQLQLLPIGEIGEILISGPCVGRGYLNDEERTKAAFLEDPFRPGVRVYRTGDLGKYLEDGTMEFIGRKDSQVKISGHRVELGEIQYALVKMNEINEAVVIAKHDSQGQNTVCAYYTGTKGEKVDKIKIKKTLQQELPDYMIPTYFRQMEKFPLNENGKIDQKKLPNLMLNEFNKNFIEELREFSGKHLPYYLQPAYYMIVEEFPFTPNGKVDRKALPDPDSIFSTKDEVIVNPRTPLEADLLLIWKELLNTEAISIHSNFFEMGGTSLKLIGLFKIINKNYPDVFHIPDLFEISTIEKQAKKSNKRQEKIERK